MATILDVITNQVRTELEDTIKSRWQDSQLLVFYRQAVQRIEAIGMNRRLSFMKDYADFEIAPGITSFALPADFFTPICLVNTDTKQELHQKIGEDWDRIISTAPMSLFNIEGDRVNLLSASTTKTNLRLRYFIHVDPAGLLVSSQSPWGGKLDTLISEYVAFRARKVDRYDTSPDVAALKDLEDNILYAYSKQNPTIVKSNGWL